MKLNPSAKRYSKALLLHGIELQALEAISTDMNVILDTLDENPELKSLINNPTLTKGDKQQVVLEVFKSLNEPSIDIIKLLINKNRINLLDQIAFKYIELYNELYQKKEATIISAFPLNKSIQEKIIDKAKLFSSSNLTVINIIDPSIIGGFILRIGDLLYDASLSKKLDKLKKELTQNNYTT